MKKILFVFLIYLICCYAPFSPEIAKSEIEKQIGMTPKEKFEMELHGLKMKVLKIFISKLTEEKIDLKGVDRIDFALYEIPKNKKIDFNQIDTRGWEKITSEKESDKLLILTRGKEEKEDMILFCKSNKNLLYARFKGSFEKNLPSSLKRIFDIGGLEKLKENLKKIKDLT